MSYERLNDEESRARVAAIIAAAESLAQDEVRPTAAVANPGGPSYRQWAIGVGVGAIALAGLVIWKQSTREVVPDQTEPPSVLVASDLGVTATVAGSPTTTLPDPETTVTTTAVVTPTTVPVVETTSPPTTAVTPPPTTTPPVVTTVVPVDAPHLVTDPAVESFTALSGDVATLAGRVSDQATVDRMLERVNEFLVVNTVENFVQLDPTATAPIPLFVVRSDGVWNGDSATLNLEFGPQIVRMATALRARPASIVSIYVHTDAHAPADETMAQTVAQAQSLKDILVAQGVNPDNIRLFAKGATEPVVDEGTPDGHQVNRRVELSVSGLYD